MCMPVQVVAVGVGAGSGGRNRGCARLCAAFSGRWSRNERTLVLTCVLFTLITAAQMVAAIAANSFALLIDAASMIVDVASYSANLWAECAQKNDASPGGRRAELSEFMVAGTSLAALWGLMLFSIVEAARALPAALARATGQDAPPGVQVDGTIVLAFALVGVALDAIVLRQFWVAGEGAGASIGASAGGEVAPVADDAMHAAADSEAGAPNAAAAPEPALPAAPAVRRRFRPFPRGARLGGGACAVGCLAACCRVRHKLNMGSALTHVSADSFRSVTTLVLSVVILSTDIDSQLADSLAVLLVGAAVAITAIGTTARWMGATRRLLCRYGLSGPCKPLGGPGVTLALAPGA
ncbi:hypothetical protein T492DRAFT_1059224 [Pavlovales sp. CCMP2436]|nr:hypothetical protein T492DRAFT_1059224 [Pavlovales sp. CCMP2436]